jgi:hypothetical protein
MLSHIACRQLNFGCPERDRSKVLIERMRVIVVESGMCSGSGITRLSTCTVQSTQTFQRRSSSHIRWASCRAARIVRIARMSLVRSQLGDDVTPSSQFCAQAQSEQQYRGYQSPTNPGQTVVTIIWPLWMTRKCPAYWPGIQKLLCSISAVEIDLIYANGAWDVRAVWGQWALRAWLGVDVITEDITSDGYYIR